MYTMLILSVLLLILLLFGPELLQGEPKGQRHK